MSISEKLEVVKGKEGKKAEKYLEESLSLKIGDYVAKKNGVVFWVDRISELPEIKHPFNTTDYRYAVIKTERENWLWYLDALSAKVSKEEAEKYFLEQIKQHQKEIKIFKNQLKDLNKI